MGEMRPLPPLEPDLVEVLVRMGMEPVDLGSIGWLVPQAAAFPPGPLPPLGRRFLKFQALEARPTPGARPLPPLEADLVEILLRMGIEPVDLGATNRAC